MVLRSVVQHANLYCRICESQIFRDWLSQTAKCNVMIKPWLKDKTTHEVSQFRSSTLGDGTLLWSASTNASPSGIMLDECVLDFERLNE